MLTTSYIHFQSSRAANSVVGDGIWQKFKLIQAFMVSLLPARMNKIQSKMKALECSQHFSHYKSMEIFSESGPILPNFEPIQAFIAVILTCKNKEDQMKNGRARVLTRFYQL